MDYTSPKTRECIDDTTEVCFDISSHEDLDRVLNTAYRKTDLRLVAWYAFVLLILKVESHNITNAAIMNMEDGTDIQHQLGGLTSEQWAWALSVYHYPYLVFEPISTLMLKKFTPRVWMSRIMITWGIIAMCQAATQNFAGLIACRCLLGLAEAGLPAGVLYHMSFWYPTEHLPLRIALQAAMSQLSGCVSGLLAFAISYMNGLQGISGWRYLFMLGGIPGVLCGLCSLYFLPNYPADAQYLTETEKEKVLASLPKTQPNSRDKTWSWAQFKDYLKDTTTYTFLIIWICHSVGSKGVNSVLPTVIYELGLTNTSSSQLMTMPPSVFGAAGLVAAAWFIRHKIYRSWAVAFCLEIFACMCYIVLIVVQSPVVKYIFIMLGTTASVSVIPLLWPERIRVAHGTTGAALAIGITSTAAGLHGITGPQLYQDSFGPTYKIPFAVSVGLTALSGVGIVVTWLLIRKKDKRAASERKEEGHELSDTPRFDSGMR